MRRHLAIAMTVAGFLLTAGAVAQNGEDWNVAPAIQGPGPDLIAWSEMQSPEPVPPAQQPSATPQAAPQPEPRPETPAPQTQPPAPNQPGEPSASGPTEAPAQAQGETPEPAAQTFTRTIGKDADTYVLRVSDTTSYKLDDQDQAQNFAGQKVRVLGSLDSASNLIHVQKIEPLT